MLMSSIYNFLDRPDVREIFGRLGRVYAVGGAVRDSVLGREPADIDFATPILPEEAQRLLPGSKAGKFGNVEWRGHTITTFRRDTYHGSRFPRVEFVGSIEEDAMRRDFTMNALYMSADGTIDDPLGGLADIDASIVRFIGDPEKSVRQDFQRAERYFRFVEELGFDNIDAASFAAAKAAECGMKGALKK